MQQWNQLHKISSTFSVKPTGACSLTLQAILGAWQHSAWEVISFLPIHTGSFLPVWCTGLTWSLKCPFREWELQPEKKNISPYLRGFAQRLAEPVQHNSQCLLLTGAAHSLSLTWISVRCCTSVYSGAIMNMCTVSVWLYVKIEHGTYSRFPHNTLCIPPLHVLLSFTAYSSLAYIDHPTPGIPSTLFSCTYCTPSCNPQSSYIQYVLPTIIAFINISLP